MDEIHNKSDREILVMIHTTLEAVLEKQRFTGEWQTKHEESDNDNFRDLSGKLNKVYIGIGAIILFLGWMAKSMAG